MKRYEAGKAIRRLQVLRPTMASVVGARKAQQREREAFMRATGIRLDAEGCIIHHRRPASIAV